MSDKLAPWLTDAQQATVEHYQAFNVPAAWFVSQPREASAGFPEGTVEVIALGNDTDEDGGNSFVWSFAIAPNGEYASSEAKVGPFETGITV